MDILWSGKQGKYDCRGIGYNSIREYLGACDEHMRN